MAFGDAFNCFDRTSVVDRPAFNASKILTLNDVGSVWIGLPFSYAEYLTKGEALKQGADEEKSGNLAAIGEVKSALEAETGTAKRGRRGSTGPKRKYDISPQSRVAAQIKRSETKARKSGATEAEAKKAGKEAGKALAAKLGI